MFVDLMRSVHVMESIENNKESQKKCFIILDLKLAITLKSQHAFFFKDN